MNPPATVPMIIGRFLGLSLLGLVCISFSGVVLGLALPFLVGYGVYAVYRYYRSGEKPQVKEQIMEPAKKVAEVAYQGSRKVTGGILGLLGGVFGFAGRILGGVTRLTGTLIGGSWTLATEVIAGSILGAALGVMIGIPTQTDKYLVFAGAGGGALLGLANGFGSIRARHRMAQLRKMELAVARA